MTNLLHNYNYKQNYNCIINKYDRIFILVPNNSADLFQLLDISANKIAECFLADKYQDWCANEISKQLTRVVEPCGLRLKNIKPLHASWPIQACHLKAFFGVQESFT